MEIDQYYNYLEGISLKIGNKVSTLDYLEDQISSNFEILNDIIKFRKEFLTVEEEGKYWGLLRCGFFGSKTEKDRITCFVICSEIDEIRVKADWKKRCELYSEKQPLFVEEPSLFQCIRKKSNGKFDYELIDSEAVNQIEESEVLKVNNSYTYLDLAINPIIVAWTKDQ